MSNHWYHTQSWYAPLISEESIEEIKVSVDTEEKKRNRNDKRWTPGRIVGLILLLMLTIAASSLALQKVGSSGSSVPPSVSSDREEMPSSPKEFFEQYYQSVETDKTEISIDRVSERPDYSMSLQKPGSEELSLQEIYEKCSPSIVAISGYEGERIGYNWGSGVVVSSDGIILTNTHVIEKCTRATVTLADDTVYEARLIGADTISDVALLKIDAEGLVPAEFGDSNSLRIGDYVAAIGNPLGESFRNTLTDGIISAIERGMNYHGRSMTLLQTNTAINEGNSGGALFNRYGQVVGITNMKMMSSYSSIEGIGFAIPSATVCEIVNALMRDGEVKGRPAIGITVGAIPENAASKYELPEGLYVSAVSEGSDAKAKGIKPGDIITAVNGTPVTATEDVNDIKNQYSVGDELIFSIWRNGETMEITVVLVDTNDIYS